MKAFLIAISLIVSWCAFSQNEISRLGQGYSYQEGALKNYCLLGEQKFFPKSFQDYSLQMVSAYDTNFDRQWGRLAIGVNFFLVGAKGSLEYLSEITQTDKSLGIEIKYQNEMGSLRYLPSSIQYHDDCGNHYVQQLDLGSQISLAVIFRLKSKTELERFKKTFTISFLFGLFQKTVQTIELFQKHEFDVNLKLLGYQRGGYPDRLSSLLKDGENCSIMRSPELCASLIQKLMEYQRQDFRRQLKDIIKRQDYERMAVKRVHLQSYGGSGFPHIPNDERPVEFEMRPQLERVFQHLKAIHLKQINYANEPPSALMDALKETEAIFEICTMNETSEDCRKAVLPDINTF